MVTREFAEIPLHGGKCPSWLFRRMARLSSALIESIVLFYSPEEFLKRISDPVFFQSIGCLSGFDWHSSGLTTTLCGAMKEGMRGREKDLGIFICGGKGGTSRRTPAEIEGYGHQQSFSFAEKLVETSRLTAKIDSTAIQDGYQLYHHTFFFGSSGAWTVVQQGMNSRTRYARRYHWWGPGVVDFVCEPHQGICGVKQPGQVLNLTDRESVLCRRSIVAISREKPDRVFRELSALKRLTLPSRHWIGQNDLDFRRIEKSIEKIHELQPVDFPDLLMVSGAGPKTIRALSLLAEVVLGTPPSFRDPVSYSFAHGGKDGIPFPVDRTLYDQTADFLSEMVRVARFDETEKKRCYRQLRLLVSEV